MPSSWILCGSLKFWHRFLIDCAPGFLFPLSMRQRCRIGGCRANWPTFFVSLSDSSVLDKCVWGLDAMVMIGCLEQNVLSQSRRPRECEEAVVHCGCYWQAAWPSCINSGHPHPRQKHADLHSFHWYGSLCHHCMFLFCHHSPCSFLQHTTGWHCKQILPKFFKLNKDTPRSLLWVSETFWSICVSVWEIGLHVKSHWVWLQLVLTWEGVNIVQVNAEKVAVTGKKRSQKLYRRHSGRPGGMTEETFESLQRRIPERIIEHAVRGMLPKGRVGISHFLPLFILCTNGYVSAD